LFGIWKLGFRILNGMTIIQPHKNNRKNIFLISLFVIASLAMAVWGLFLYNQMVSFRHDLTDGESALHKAEISNAELKDKLYNLTNTINFSSSTNSQSLILDKNPQYVVAN